MKTARLVRGFQNRIHSHSRWRCGKSNRCSSRSPSSPQRRSVHQACTAPLPSELAPTGIVTDEAGAPVVGMGDGIGDGEAGDGEPLLPQADANTREANRRARRVDKIDPPGMNSGSSGVESAVPRRRRLPHGASRSLDRPALPDIPGERRIRRSACAAGPEASGQAARREGCFSGAIARQPRQCVFALSGGAELESRESPHRFQHLIQGPRRHGALGAHQEALVDQPGRRAQCGSIATGGPSRPASTAAAASIGKRPGSAPRRRNTRCSSGGSSR